VIEAVDPAAGERLHLDHYAGRRLPYVAVSGNGVRQLLQSTAADSPGRLIEVVDASGGYASACLGANPPAVTSALTTLLPHCAYATDEIGSIERSRLLDELFGRDGWWHDRFPGEEYHVSGRNSGSEGMELALRLVLESTWDHRALRPSASRGSRRTILAFEGAWHGWTAGVVPLLNRRHFRVGLPDFAGAVTVVFAPFGDAGALDAVFAAHAADLLAVIVEPVQGDAGILVPPPGYLRRLSALCRTHGVWVVADEVLTFAKTGEWFAMRDDDGAPIATDITVIGKSLGFGVLPVSMVIARRALNVRASGAVSTCDLRPLACGMMSAGLRYIREERLLEQSHTYGEALRGALRDVVAEFPTVYREVRGVGFLNGVELTEEAAPFARELRIAFIEHGVYAELMAGAGRRSRGQRFVFPTVRVAPPLVATPDDLDAIVDGISRGTAAFVRAGMR
jgi:acetylornithine/N-succinyldiaminopimelate aminotransferase